uniref:Alpha/beta hydrolase n=1 Tax=Ignisphaera aggregans TaxID=334771 RepID=A0A7C5UWG7_9CREN
MRYEEGSIKLYGDYNAFYRCWFAESQLGVVVGVHGFCEHSGRYIDFGRFLAGNGYAFCMHDLRGHGRSAKSFDRGFVERFEFFIKDLDKFMEFVMSRSGAGSIYLFGHSMGGLIAVYYTGVVGRGVRTLITSGAAVYLPPPAVIQRFLATFLSFIAPRKRVSLPIDPRELSTDESVAKAYIEDPLVIKNPTIRLVYELYRVSKEVWKFAGRISTPTLILHGKEDRIVPVEASQRLYNAISSKDKHLVIYDGMKHEILNERNKAKVYNDILEWLKTH